MAQFVDYSVNVSSAGDKPFKAMRRRMEAPMLRQNFGFQAQGIIRNRSRGSIDEQFASGGLGTWAPRKPFGARPGSASPMNRTGAYRRAWTKAGPASVTIYGEKNLTIGVDSIIFPMMAAHQSGARSFRVRASARTSKGRLKMQMLLGLTYGVWMPEAKLIAGLEIPTRPVRMTQGIEASLSRELARYLATGRKA